MKIKHSRRLPSTRLCCRWSWIVLLGLIGLPVADCLAARSDAARPNILLIMADDLGYGDLASFGAPDLKSPNIDQLIGSGMRFANFYANCPVCSPTRAATLTGRYPDLVGVPGVIRTDALDSWGYFHLGAKTLPQLLSGGGYFTALVGKWHLGLRSENHPCRRGFDLFHGFLGDMMDDYFHHRRHGINYMRHNDDPIDPKGHATDLFTQWAIDVIQDRARHETPWFLFVAYNAPHTPIQPRQDWLQKVQAREPGISDKRANLVALIEQMDDGIGKILHTLDVTNQREDTLVVFVSDNGGLLRVGARCGPFRGGKQDMYEGGVRIPAGVSWPGRIRSGSESKRVVLTMDLLPTLCAAAGIEVVHPIDGVSFLPTLRGQRRNEPQRTLFFIRREGNKRYQGQDYYAVREGDWKLVHNNPFAPLELYNLQADPTESRNLADREIAVFDRLAVQLRAHLQRAGAVPWQAP
jgi:arylsulfatase A-like enzyme